MVFIDIYIFSPSFKPETVKLFPENLVTYKVFGEHQGPHYAHYDLVGGRLVSIADRKYLTGHLIVI